jgi:hypothetical protein
MMYRTIVGTALGAAIFCLAAKANAADSKIYHGSICKPQHPDEANYGPLWEGLYATTVNACQLPASEEHPRIFCPVTRDLTDSSTGLAEVALEFNNRDYGCYEPTRIWAYLYAMNDDSDAMLYVDYEYRSSTTVGVSQLHFDGLTTTLTTHNDNEGSYVLVAHPGATDWLQQIMVTEANGTN